MKPLAWLAALLFAAQAAASTANVSTAKGIDAYKAQIAKLIYRASSKEIFEGAAPPLLKSIVVLEVSIDAKGSARARVVRSNGFKELEQRALQSVKRASPLPRWSSAGSKPVTYYETWLFRNDGRFQIRSIAPPQASA
jgi:periplasmic protein TonB